MRKLVLILTPLVCALATAAHLPAQAVDIQAIRRVVAADVLHWAPLVLQFDGRSFLLDRRPVGFTYDRALRAERTVTDTRTKAELAELASALHGRVATDADYFVCRVAAGATCTFAETNTALVRIGEPRIAGDTAIVTVNISSVTGGRGQSRLSSIVYAVWLTRSGGKWTAVSHKEVWTG